MFRVMYNGIKRGRRLIAPAGSKVCATIEEVRSVVADKESIGYSIWAVIDMTTGTKITL